MKAKIFLAAAALTALSASAQWPTGDGQLPVYDHGTIAPDASMAGASDGNTWLWMPNCKTDELGELNAVYNCQIYNEAGYPVMGEQPAQVAFYPYQSWWMFQARNLFIDKDNNAIFAVQDCRVNSLIQSSSVYKISPTGEQLWGKDGVTVTGTMDNFILVSFGGIQLEDGSYVFAWTNCMDYVGEFWVGTSRVSADGKVLQEASKLDLGKTTHQYCWLANAGNNQYFLVYTEGSGDIVKVMKYDFDGTPVWSKAVEVYNGGFGSSPAWFKIEVQSVPDGGVLIDYYADPESTNFEDPYLAYVTGDGSLGFNIKNGLRIDWQEYTRDIGIKATYDPKTDSFIAIYNAESANQSYGILKAQRISKNGDLLWGEEGLIIGEMIEGGYGYMNVVPGEPGRVAFFYEMHTDAAAREISNYALYYDVETGKPVWDEPTTFGPLNTPKGDLQAVNCGKFWTAIWKGQMEVDGAYSSSSENLYLQRINFDGTVGDGGAGIENISADKAPLNVTVNGSQVSFENDVNVFDINGRQVASGRQATLAPGMYMGSDGDNVAKFIIR
ncbi:MAG: hypothetical protein HUK14_08445 [Muribaculaceae bacterium]|nr:hypothetical protein [Muribaculaceae bacterium]